MKLRTGIAALLLLCMQGRPQAQPTTPGPLQPGDKVPDVVLHMVNYKKARAGLHDFKGKLLILDFWSPRCSSCVHEIAALDNLQKQFKDSLCILLVCPKKTGDTKASVRKFIQGYQQRIKGGFIVPCVTEDSMLAKLFPFRTLSELVWINKAVYTAHTEAGTATANTIYALIHDLPVHMVQKTNRIYYEEGHVLTDYINDTMQVRQVHPHIFEGDIKSLDPMLGMSRDSIAGNKLLVINCSIKTLYELAFRAPVPLYNNLIINKVTGDSLFANINNSAANSFEKLYSYELVSHGNDEAMFSQMQADLTGYFKVYGEVQKYTLRCLVLQAVDTMKFISRGGIEGNSLYEAIQGERVINNQPLSILTERLNELLDIPVTDETGIKQAIDLRLPNNLADIPALQKKLEEQGIALVYAIRPVDVFVLNPVRDTTTGKR